MNIYQGVHWLITFMVLQSRVFSIDSLSSSVWLFDDKRLISGANSKRITLSWVRRLKIAVDAAKGIIYSFCKK